MHRHRRSVRPPGHPSRTGEKGEPAVQRDEIYRARITASENGGQRLGILRQPEEMRGRVSEAGRQVAKNEPFASGGDVVRDPQRAVPTGDHRRRIVPDAAGKPLRELPRVPGGGDVEVRVEGLAGQLDRAPDPGRARAARCLLYTSPSPRD